MPIRYVQYEGENDPIIFPLTLNDLPMDLTGITHLVLVKSGLDGRLAGTLTSGSALSIYETLEGKVRWALSASDLEARYSPYRIYFRTYTSGTTQYLTVPRGDYFLIEVKPNLL